MQMLIKILCEFISLYYLFIMNIILILHRIQVYTHTHIYIYIYIHNLCYTMIEIAKFSLKIIRNYIQYILK